MSSYSGFPDISTSHSVKPKKCKAEDMLKNKCQLMATHPMTGYCEEHHKQYEQMMNAHTAKMEEIARQKEEDQKKYFDEDIQFHPIIKNDKLEGYECTDLVNDAMACKIFLSQMTQDSKSLIHKDDDCICIFDKNTGLWRTDDDSVLREISRANLRLFKMEYNEEKELWIRAKKCSDYSGVVANRKKIFEAIRTELENSHFIEKNIETNIGKILFKNGIYTFGTGFKEGFDPSIVFFHQMERNFPVRDEAKIAEVKRILFDDLFETELKGNYMRMATARAIYGDYRTRKSPFCRGDTASGKGMMTYALLKAFPGLVKSFNANELIYNKLNKDEEQKLMFMKSYKTCRLMISNEINIERNDKGDITTYLNSNLFKSIVSGGDIMKVRGMREESSEFVNRATLFFMANDFPSFMPKDKAVEDRRENVWFPKSFVQDPNPLISTQVKRDETIKAKFESSEYQDAVFWVIVDSYNTLVKDKEYFKPSLDDDFMEVLSQEDKADSFESVLLEKYDFSVEKDSIPFEEINTYLQRRLGITPVKIGLEFKTLSKIKPEFKFESKATNGKRYRHNLIRKKSEQVQNPEQPCAVINF